MKLFELPVYALTRRTLRNRVLHHKTTLAERFPGVDRKIMERSLEADSYPQRLWDYNHILGYIVISTNGRDILFDIYLTTSKIERYNWHSRQKRFLYNISAPGTHFYIKDDMTNENIQDAVASMLTSIIKDYIPKRFYVDRETFDTLNKHLDYCGAVKKET